MYFNKGEEGRQGEVNHMSVKIKYPQIKVIQ